MKLKSIIAGTTLLLIAGYFFSLRYQLKNPDKVLTEIKKQYSDIEGAYIDYTPENYKNSDWKPLFIAVVLLLQQRNTIL